MNKKTGILAVAMILITASFAMAAPTKINTYVFTPASEVNGGLQPGMYVVRNLPPLDVGMHVGQVLSDGNVTIQEGTITTTDDKVLTKVLLKDLYFVSSCCQPPLPTSPP